MPANKKDWKQMLSIQFKNLEKKGRTSTHPKVQGKDTVKIRKRNQWKTEQKKRLTLPESGFMAKCVT